MLVLTRSVVHTVQAVLFWPGTQLPRPSSLTDMLFVELLPPRRAWAWSCTTTEACAAWTQYSVLAGSGRQRLQAKFQDHLAFQAGRTLAAAPDPCRCSSPVALPRWPLGKSPSKARVLRPECHSCSRLAPPVHSCPGQSSQPIAVCATGGTLSKPASPHNKTYIRSQPGESYTEGHEPCCPARCRPQLGCLHPCSLERCLCAPAQALVTCQLQARKTGEERGQGGSRQGAFGLFQDQRAHGGVTAAGNVPRAHCMGQRIEAQRGGRINKNETEAAEDGQVR